MVAPAEPQVSALELGKESESETGEVSAAESRKRR